MHGLEATLLRQMGINDQKAGTLFLLHLEKNSLMVGYLDCSRAAELHLVQLWRQTGRPRKNACAPVKNLLPVGTVDLQSRRSAQEGRHLSADASLFKTRPDPKRNYEYDGGCEWQEYPGSPTWTVSLCLGALVRQPTQDSAFQRPLLRNLLNGMLNALVRISQALKESRALPAPGEMIKAE